MESNWQGWTTSESQQNEKALEIADSRAFEMVAGAGFEPATFGL
jgi:hypothetical protein